MPYTNISNIYDLIYPDRLDKKKKKLEILKTF